MVPSNFVQSNYYYYIQDSMGLIISADKDRLQIIKDGKLAAIYSVLSSFQFFTTYHCLFVINVSDGLYYNLAAYLDKQVKSKPIKEYEKPSKRATLNLSRS